MRNATLCRTWATSAFVLGGLAVGACQPAPFTPSAPQAQAESGWAGQAANAYVRLPARHVTPAFVAATGFNRDHVRDEVYAFGYLKRSVLQTLDPAVFQDLIELDAKEWAKERFDPRTLARLPDASAVLEDDTAFEDYHDYEALTSELQTLADANPGLAELTTIGKSVEGRELWMLKLSDQADADEAEPKLLYIANMHGDETVGRELMIYLARDLLARYASGDARVKNLLDHAQVYLIPSMNPDGFEAGERHNASGVDLNRDFPDFTADPTDTPAGRAPETAAIMALHRAHHFELALNFHGGEVCFNLPWDTQANPTNGRFADDALISSLGRTYADTNRTMSANDGGGFDRGLTYGYEWYEVDGGMQDWSIHYRGSTHATVELSYTKYPRADKLPTMWAENKEALLAYLESGLRGVHLDVRDASGAPVRGATIQGLGRGNTRALKYDLDSVVHRAMNAGETSVQVSAPGFAAQTLSVSPWSFADDARVVTLAP